MAQLILNKDEVAFVIATYSTLWLTVCGQLLVGVGVGTVIVSTYSDVLSAVL